MDPKKPHLTHTPLAPLVVAVGLTSACSDHKLPPNPVPNADLRRPVPSWFDPNAKWNPQGNDTQVYIEGKVVFAIDRATLRKPSEEVLQKLLAFLKERPDVTRLRVEGHTDSTASNEYNQELSARRSLAVCDWLVDKGIDHIRLVAVGFGEEKPRAPNELAAGRAENRRTEFHVMEVNGRPFGPRDALDGGMVLTVLSAEERERLRNPPKVEHPKVIVVKEGDIIKPHKPPPKKAVDDEDVVQAPSNDTAGDAGPIQPNKKKEGDKDGGGAPGGGAPPAGGGTPPAGGGTPPAQ
jgi:OmpA-OmpF porin, OOP family